MPISEFDIIAKFFTKPIRNTTLIHTGVGDDAAVFNIPDQCECVTSIDTMIAGIHFPENTAAFDIGYKALAVSLSDVAAMGGKPFSVLLSLTLPESNQSWLKDFAQGFFSLAKKYQIELIGGDTTRGPLTVSTVVHGIVPMGEAIYRGGAHTGDLIYVTGTLGDAGLALQRWCEKKPTDVALLNRLNRPQPRVNAGLALRYMATAAIDISDGLVTDLKKLLHASQVGAILYADKIPLSAEIKKYISVKEALSLALSFGDDYELCFTVPQKKQKQLERNFSDVGCDIHCVGEITSASGLIILDENKKPLILEKEGYEHFKT